MRLFPHSAKSLLGRPLIRVSYYTGVPNVGDLANADLLAAITRYSPFQTRTAHRKHILAIGSNMASANRNSLVWGTGVMHPDRGIGNPNPGSVFAVRGKLSARALSEAGALHRDVPLGDPAYLIPSLLGVEKFGSGRGNLGVVPHYVDRTDPFFLRLAKDPNVTDLDVRGLSVEHFIRRMATCDAIVSSSLHGLVFAEAMQIPNLWVSLGDRVLGSGYKFHDWFTTMGEPEAAPYRPHGTENVKTLMDMARLHSPIIDPSALLEAFPYHLLDSCSLPPGREFETLSFRACRHGLLTAFLDLSNGWSPDDMAKTIRCIGSQSPLIGIGQRATEALTVARNAGTPLTHAIRDMNLNTATRTFFNLWAEPQPYAVVDPGFAASWQREIGAMQLRLQYAPLDQQAAVEDSLGHRLTVFRAGAYPSA